jgi:hypothetical protein
MVLGLLLVPTLLLSLSLSPSYGQALQPSPSPPSTTTTTPPPTQQKDNLEILTAVDSICQPIS